jgi:hypothetical protein
VNGTAISTKTKIIPSTGMIDVLLFFYSATMKKFRFVDTIERKQLKTPPVKFQRTKVQKND